MGLDQYARTLDENGEKREIAYWRKHPNLQGWMERLWNSRGNEGEFNCEDVELSREDLEELREEILGNSLPQTGGFFFGDDSDEYYKEKDLQFITQALDYIDNGQKVWYSSWW